MRLYTFPHRRDFAIPNPIPFPRSQVRGSQAVTFPDEVLARLESVSRRIDDLARELKCLGYFDDEDSGRPRAA